MYEYKCPDCGQRYHSDQRGDRLRVTLPHDPLTEGCHTCGQTHSPMVRVFGFQYIAPMPEHWNKTVDRPISSMKQFKDALAREGERLSTYTQVEQDLQPLDPEQAKQGVTEEGLDSTNRVRVAQGLKPIKL